MDRIVVPFVALVAAVPVAAQTSATLPQAAAAPINIILPNYSNVAVGEIGSLEGNAYLARVGDSSAAYYNPAGLTLAKNSVSGSGGAFKSWLSLRRTSGNAARRFGTFQR